jgi:hypothetical protein
LSLGIDPIFRLRLSALDLSVPDGQKGGFPVRMRLILLCGALCLIASLVAGTPWP